MSTSLSAAKRAEARQAWLFFLPALVLVGCVSFLPLGYALRQSLHASDYLEIGEFVGLQNFVHLFIERGGWRDLRTSFLYVGGTLVLAMPLGIGLALLLAQPFPLRGLFRTILILPWAVSQMVTAVLWAWLYDGRVGPIADALGRLGITMGNPLTEVAWALPAVIVADAWASFPLIMVFVLAGLQNISPEVTDAARIDAPSPWRRFLFVTLPLLKAPILVALVLTTLHAFNSVTLILVMTGGGPVDATEVLALRIFKEGFQFFRMELASAAAVAIFAINVVFALGCVRWLRRTPA